MVRAESGRRTRPDTGRQTGGVPDLPPPSPPPEAVALRVDGQGRHQQQVHLGDGAGPQQARGLPDGAGRGVGARGPVQVRVGQQHRQDHLDTLPLEGVQRGAGAGLPGQRGVAGHRPHRPQQRAGGEAAGQVAVHGVGVRGVSADYDQFGGYEADRGRTISRIEIQRSRPLAYVGSETAEKLFKGRNPLE